MSLKIRKAKLILSDGSVLNIEYGKEVHLTEGLFKELEKILQNIPEGAPWNIKKDATIKECRREYDRKYRAKNRDKIRARDRAGYRKNRKKRLETVSKYYQQNRARILAYKKRRYALKKRQEAAGLAS